MTQNNIPVEAIISPPTTIGITSAFFRVEGDKGSDVAADHDELDGTITIYIGEPGRDVSYLVTRIPGDGLDALVAKLQAAQKWRDERAAKE